MDLNTGEPVLDFDGNLLLTDVSRAFNQYLDVLFHTPLMEEVSLPTWGLPIKQIFRQQFSSNWENMIKSYIVQALNPRFEPLIDEIKAITIEQDGSTLNIEVHVTSIYGTDNLIEVSLNE